MLVEPTRLCTLARRTRLFVLPALVGLVLAATAASPGHAVPLYPSGKTFNCDYRWPDGRTGRAVITFQHDGSVARQAGTLTNRIVNGPTLTPRYEMTKPRWEGTTKAWDFVQTNEGIRCKLSIGNRALSWSQCSNGVVQTCTEAGVAPQQFPPAAGPHLLVDAILIETDHEGFPRGAPEVELFLADPKPCAQGWCYEVRPRTDILFNGRPSLSRPTALPDVNATGRWYTISPPLAIPFGPSGVGLGLVLMEDDDEPGVMRRSSFTIDFFCAFGDPTAAGFQTGLAQNITCIPIVSGLVRSLVGGGDDPFDGMIVLTNGIDFQSMTVDGGEWQLRVRAGYQ